MSRKTRSECFAVYHAADVADHCRRLAGERDVEERVDDLGAGLAVG